MPQYKQYSSRSQFQNNSNDYNRKYAAAGKDAEHRDGEVKMHVCNLPYSTSNYTLEALFLPFGEVLETFVFKRPHPFNNTRSALVRMACPNAASKAIDELDGIEWNGQYLRIRPSIHNQSAFLSQGLNVPSASQGRSTSPGDSCPEHHQEPTCSSSILATLRTLQMLASPLVVSSTSLAAMPTFEGTGKTNSIASFGSRTSFDASSDSDGSVTESNERVSQPAEDVVYYVHDPYNQSLWGEDVHSKF